MTQQNQLSKLEQTSLEITKKADITKYAVAMAKTAIAFDVKLSEERMKVYYDLFKDDYTDEEINFACKQLIKTFRAEYGVKFPLPVHFIEFMDERKELRLKNDLILRYAEHFKGDIDYLEWSMPMIRRHIKICEKGMANV